METSIPQVVPNIIGGVHSEAVSGDRADKFNPDTGEMLCRLVRSATGDVAGAVAAAKAAQPDWEKTPAVERGLILLDVVMAMKAQRREIAGIVAAETGKSMKEALGETDAAVQCGLFYAGEGQRLYGRTCTSRTPDKQALTIRQAVGVAGLIIAANTPIANVAWKVFPALVCGNTAVLKASEDAPATAWMVGVLAEKAGLPAGVLNIVQGLGEEAGAPLAAHGDVGVISFTGSTEVGRIIAETAGRRLARISLELGGKNPLLVCDDADLEKAVHWSVLSAFSNAGQRCASGSRIIVLDKVYDEFRERLVAATRALKVGPSDGDDLGPVINARQLQAMTESVEQAVRSGAGVLCGGGRMTDPVHTRGFYMAPTILEDVDPEAVISVKELFGPITCLYRAPDFAGALALVNNSPYGLTACIHTKDMNRAGEFCLRAKAGVVVVNAGTFGSEPHMPFGGRGLSGNGSREPGTEALDVYSELKNIYLHFDPEAV